MKKKRILVVDEELDMRTFVCTLLGTCGYQTIVATKGSEGLRKAKEFRPVLIIMDVTMSKESGIHLYRDLKMDDDLKDIPVIMLSDIAKKTFFRPQNLLSAYMGKQVPEPEAYLEKPPESEELLQWTQTLLATRR